MTYDVILVYDALDERGRETAETELMRNTTTELIHKRIMEIYDDGEAFPNTIRIFTMSSEATQIQNDLAAMQGY